MELLKFIESNTDWKEKIQLEPYCVKVDEDEHYVILKYDQIHSDFNIPLVRECRGIIITKDTHEVVCHPFDKFGNYGEGYCPEIDWATARVQQKIDGCCDAEVKLITKTGEKAIKEIVEGEEVLTFNFEKGQAEFNVVRATSEKPNNDDWYEIELENGQKIKLTGNHRVWVENLKCYRQVKDLKGDEEVKFI